MTTTSSLYQGTASRSHSRSRSDQIGMPQPPYHPRLYPSSSSRALSQSSLDRGSSPSSEPGSIAHVKAYQTNKPTQKYQPSRGAQRDAKWQAKSAERAQSQVQAQVTLAQMVGRENTASPVFAAMAPPSSQYAMQMHELAKMRSEQQHVIEEVRRAHIASVAERQLATERAAKIKEEEKEKKIRRIQLQVFVHARPTACSWGKCKAVLNSWALLEKHILHAHLHTNWTIPQKDGLIHCQWSDCQGKFQSPETCYKHVLIGHMKDYSARCPFNCLFHGTCFSDLTAHIDRRHNHCTPEDFTPGLIHHKPNDIPPASALPSLPREHIHLDPTTDLPLNRALPYQGLPNARVKKMVIRRCMKGSKPTKDDFVDKRGAGAAIRAIVENARRLACFIGPLTEEEAAFVMEDGKDNMMRPPQTDSIQLIIPDFDREDRNEVILKTPMTARSTPRTAVPLLDVRRSLKDAKETAEQELASLEIPVSAKRAQTHSTGNREDSSDPYSSDSSSTSMVSEYRQRRGVPSLILQTAQELTVKRSERLKRKGTASAPTSPTEIVNKRRAL